MTKENKLNEFKYIRIIYLIYLFIYFYFFFFIHFLLLFFPFKFSKPNITLVLSLIHISSCIYVLRSNGHLNFCTEQALHASWEPRHSIHCYRFPGQQYVKLGAALRHFGYTIVALHGCLQTEIQVSSDSCLCDPYMFLILKINYTELDYYISCLIHHRYLSFC